MLALKARLALGFVCVALLAGVVQAQDARTSLAQKAARDFLALTDRNDAKASWEIAGKQFKNAIPADRWAKALTQVRSPFGALVGRTLVSTRFTSNFPGAAAEGDYVLLVFRTNFAKKIDVNETVTLEREPDGVWRVIGYLVR